MFQIFQALWLGIIATLGVAIAYHQYRTAKDKLNLDLLDRRMKVLAALRKYLGLITSGEGPSINDSVQYYIDCIEPSRFLFGPEVLEFLQRVEKQGETMRMDILALAAYPPDSPERQRAAERRIETTMSVGETAGKLYQPFQSYMEFAHIRNSGSSWLHRLYQNLRHF